MIAPMTHAVAPPLAPTYAELVADELVRALLGQGVVDRAHLVALLGAMPLAERDLRAAVRRLGGLGEG